MLKDKIEKVMESRGFIVYDNKKYISLLYHYKVPTSGRLQWANNRRQIMEQLTHTSHFCTDTLYRIIKCL